MGKTGNRARFDAWLSHLGILPSIKEMAELMDVDAPQQIGTPTAQPREKDTSDEEDGTTFVQRQVINRWTVSETIRQENLNKILCRARNILASDKEPPADRDVSMDWMLKFMSLAGDISDETLQCLWSRLMATEVKAPGHASLHSLFRLANMSKAEAYLFADISRYVLTFQDTHVLLNDKEFNDEHGILSTDILHLDEYGLVASSGTLGWSQKLNPSTPFRIVYGEEQLEIYGEREAQEIRIQVFTLKEAGETLWPIVEKQYIPTYLEDVRRFLSRDHGNLRMVITRRTP